MMSAVSWVNCHVPRPMRGMVRPVCPFLFGIEDRRSSSYSSGCCGAFLGGRTGVVPRFGAGFSSSVSRSSAKPALPCSAPAPKRLADQAVVRSGFRLIGGGGAGAFRPICRLCCQGDCCDQTRDQRSQTRRPFAGAGGLCCPRLVDLAGQAPNPCGMKTVPLRGVEDDRTWLVLYQRGSALAADRQERLRKK